MIYENLRNVRFRSAAGRSVRNAITVYRGQLMDASCCQQNSSNTSGKIWVTCGPSDTTTNFAIHTNWRVRMLDAAGNDKAETAFKQGILKGSRRPAWA
jgi:hypothetical protein